MGYWIVGDVKDTKGCIGVEARDGGQGVVGDVELFEGGERGKIGDLGESVGLDGENAEVCEVVDVLREIVSKNRTQEAIFRTHLDLCDLVLA